MTEIYKPQPHITQYYRKNDSSVDFKYICIKKDYFDVKMIYLNYKDIKKPNYIEIIYKSPSAFLEGIFLKTPKINGNLITIIHKEAYNVTNIKLQLNYKEHGQFIQILRQIDEYLSSYLTNNIEAIKGEMLNDKSSLAPLSSQSQIYRYESMIRFKTGGDIVEITMKSYLDKHTIQDLELKFPTNNYVFTFNISNIYFGTSNFVPLIKCNRCESIF
jgi:hypothetical protein